MRLVVDGSIPREWHAWFNAAFDVAVRELGLDQYNDVSVLVWTDRDSVRDNASVRNTLELHDGVRWAFMQVGGGLGLKDLPEAFAHEMKHVQQMASGRLTRVGRTNIWEGKPHSPSEVDVYMSHLGKLVGAPRAYAIGRPWETEAYAAGREIGQKISQEVPCGPSTR